MTSASPIEGLLVTIKSMPRGTFHVLKKPVSRHSTSAVFEDLRQHITQRFRGELHYNTKIAIVVESVKDFDDVVVAPSLFAMSAPLFFSCDACKF